MKQKEKIVEEKTTKTNNNIIVIIITCMLILLIAVGLSISFITKKHNNLQNENVIKNNDNRTKYIANSHQEFVKYINELDGEIQLSKSNNSKVKNYEIIYNNFKLVATTKDDIELTYYYDIYYDNNLLDTNKLYDALRYGTTKAYLLSENDNNAYVLVSEIVPVAQHSRYSINVIDENGKLLLSQLVISQKIDVDKSSINYSFETKMLEELHLGVEAEHNDNFCNYLEEKYPDNSYVVKGQHSYIYNNDELSLIKNEETTIKHYKDIYNCN